MGYQNLRSLSRTQGCKVLIQEASHNPQVLGEKPIQDSIDYIMSIRGLSSKEKSFLVLLSNRFMRETPFRASTKWLALKLSCSRVTLHRALQGLEGRWIVIRRSRGKQSFTDPLLSSPI